MVRLVLKRLATASVCVLLLAIGLVTRLQLSNEHVTNEHVTNATNITMMYSTTGGYGTDITVLDNTTRG